MRRSLRNSPRAVRSSKVLASHTVQVTNDAKARPTITAFTTRSEFSNMPQGDRSCGKSAPLIMCSPGSGALAGAAVAEEAGTDAAGTFDAAPGLAPGCADPLGVAAGAPDAAGAAGAPLAAGFTVPWPVPCRRA